MNAKTGSKRASYSSPTIRARRARLLEVTRELIAEQGMGGFSIGEVSLRANVAKQTIYNIFQTRERMIATAINEYFEQREGEIQYRSARGTMAWMIERTMTAGRKAQTIPNYMSAMMTIYHSLDPDPEIWAAIHRANVYPHKAWIEGLAREGRLEAWVVPDMLIEDIGLTRNALILRWCRGELDDDDMLRRSLIDCLMSVAAASVEPVRAEVQAKLREIAEAGLPEYGLPPTPRPPIPQ